MAMKISGTQRNAPVIPTSAGPKHADPSAKRQQAEDTLELSEEALAALRTEEAGKAEKATEDVRIKEPLSPEEKKLQDKLSAMRSMKQMLQTVRQQSAQMAEQSEKQADAMKESLEKMKRCSKIAKNIQKGHKVPPKDEKYLLENDPKLYMMAMALRMLEDPDNKKVKSELKDEEEQQEAEAIPGAESAAQADIAVEMGADVSTE